MMPFPIFLGVVVLVPLGVAVWLVLWAMRQQGGDIGVDKGFGLGLFGYAMLALASVLFGYAIYEYERQLEIERSAIQRDLEMWKARGKP